MNILILGGTGFIGSAIAKYLLAENYQVAVSTRQNRLHGKSINSVKHFFWDGDDCLDLEEVASNYNVIINLIGENLSDGRWTNDRKESIITSRIKATTALSKVLPKLKNIQVLLQASAVGYYGYWEEESKAPIVNEDSPLGSDFLAQTCNKWENSIELTNMPQEFRHCTMRFAPVLGNGGMIKQLLPPFKMLAGGIPGHGRQPISWIHINDLAKAMSFLIKNENAKGVFNFSAPNPCTMQEFIISMANIINKPYAFPLPSSLLRLLYGEMARSIILGGQRAYPKHLHDLGFEFDFPNIKPALQDIFENYVEI